ncbi:hypothetical protein [Paenibacillus hunanensis]|uniref:Uncharacterized protein n=1 Tax=Paenibacillus hunanensis TaxID=539262 RepID=A0ABU1IV03_9BACL|nr:hypothetical protein [Paenibacillus hunanensis]MDR6243004.1 hypothetical protein [Paenibacillus hunanensis]GGJ12702.1 hypothetical protein GCM10008022_22240 [Paenibacillus hunanensis]
MNEEFLQELHRVGREDEWHYKLMMQGIRRTLAARKSEGIFRRYLRTIRKNTTGGWY